MSFDPVDLFKKVYKFFAEETDTYEEVSIDDWVERYDAWVGGTAAWINDPLLLPPRKSQLEAFSACVAAQGFRMLTKQKLTKEKRNIHTMLEYILRNEGKTDISATPLDGVFLKPENIVQPYVTATTLDPLMDFSTSSFQTLSIYQVLIDIVNKPQQDVDASYTKILLLGWSFERYLWLPMDIRVCDVCLNLYYKSKLTQHRSAEDEISHDYISMWTWLKNNINLIFKRDEFTSFETIVRNTAFIMWYCALIKVVRMEYEKTIIDPMLDKCLQHFLRRIEHKPLK